MNMSSKRLRIPYILGAVSVILIYTTYYSIVLTKQDNAICDDKVPVPKHVKNKEEEVVVDTTSSSSVQFEVNEAVERDSLKERLADVKARIKVVDELLEGRKEELEISEAMIKLALKHKTSVKRLIEKFKEVLLTNKTFAIGVLGGSISVGVGANGTKGIYATTLAHYLEKMLGIEVTVGNGAVGATNSYYYGYCFQTHCNVHNVDLLFWEFALNDKGNPRGFLGQERLTRMILADLPNQPQLIYMNFLGGKQEARYEECVNNQQNGSLQLSPYYDVPSISMPDAVCKLVKKYKAGYLFGSHDGSHPGPEGHDMAAIFLTELIKEVLIDTITSLEKELNKSGAIEQFLIEYSRPNYSNSDDGKLHQKDLPPILFNTTAITHPQCWSLMGSEYRPTEMTLMPQDKFGWKKFTLAKKDYRGDLKQVWHTFRPGAFIEFEVSIPPYRGLKSTIAITTITLEPDKCGCAKVFLDDKYLETLDCRHYFLVTVVHDVAFNVLPGTYVLKIITVGENGFNIASLSTAYEIPDQQSKSEY
ncbi:uncharacterized protein [Ptychodera flava]|uniref:uncharacterized protein n=1 Tax=Ptychodera flava TaxID=63121 RepID=UPI003969DAF8